MLALVALIIIAFGLFTLIPQLGSFADDLYQLYYGEVIREFDLIRRRWHHKPDHEQATVHNLGCDELQPPKT